MFVRLLKCPKSRLESEVSSRRSSLTQTFVESYVDFEVAHLSVLMVRSCHTRRFLT